MYSKTCPIPVKNVRDKLIEMTPLSSLLSDWSIVLNRRSANFDKKSSLEMIFNTLTVPVSYGILNPLKNLPPPS
jgi:hypothetical protein